MTTLSRVTRQDAATRLRGSEATVDRMIKRGELQIGREPQGARYKVWVLLEDAEETPADTSDESSVYSNDGSAANRVNTVPAPAENSVQTREDEVYTGVDELTALRTEN